MSNLKQKTLKETIVDFLTFSHSTPTPVEIQNNDQLLFQIFYEWREIAQINPKLSGPVKEIYTKTYDELRTRRLQGDTQLCKLERFRKEVSIFGASLSPRPEENEEAYREFFQKLDEDQIQSLLLSPIEWTLSKINLTPNECEKIWQAVHPSSDFNNKLENLIKENLRYDFERRLRTPIVDFDDHPLKQHLINASPLAKKFAVEHFNNTANQLEINQISNIREIIKRTFIFQPDSRFYQKPANSLEEIDPRVLMDIRRITAGSSENYEQPILKEYNDLLKKTIHERPTFLRKSKKRIAELIRDEFEVNWKRNHDLPINDDFSRTNSYLLLRNVHSLRLEFLQISKDIELFKIAIKEYKKQYFSFHRENLNIPRFTANLPSQSSFYKTFERRAAEILENAYRYPTEIENYQNQLESREFQSLKNFDDIPQNVIDKILTQTNVNVGPRTKIHMLSAYEDWVWSKYLYAQIQKIKYSNIEPAYKPMVIFRKIVWAFKTRLASEMKRNPEDARWEKRPELVLKNQLNILDLFPTMLRPHHQELVNDLFAKLDVGLQIGDKLFQLANEYDKEWYKMKLESLTPPMSEDDVRKVGGFFDSQKKYIFCHVLYRKQLEDEVRDLTEAATQQYRLKKELDQKTDKLEALKIKLDFHEEYLRELQDEIFTDPPPNDLVEVKQRIAGILTPEKVNAITSLKNDGCCDDPEADGLFGFFEVQKYDIIGLHKTLRRYNDPEFEETLDREPLQEKAPGPPIAPFAPRKPKNRKIREKVIAIQYKK